MQICTSPQEDNHASTPSLSFLQVKCPYCCPTNSIKSLKATALKSELQSSINTSYSHRSNSKFPPHSQPQITEMKLTKKSSMHVSVLPAKPWSNFQIVNRWLNNTPSKHSDCSTYNSSKFTTAKSTTAIIHNGIVLMIMYKQLILHAFGVPLGVTPFEFCYKPVIQTH